MIVVILYSYDLYRNGNQKHLVAWFSSGGFVLITFPICVRLIYLHLSHWYMPNVQKYVVRIIWMIPLYSVESWLSLRFHKYALYIETLRSCYEAYAIYSFLYFLISVLGEETQLISILKRKSRERGAHFWPLNYAFAPWEMGYNFLHHCKFGVLQYVVIKNLTAIIIIILENRNLYLEGIFSIYYGYLYLCIIDTASQAWALYSLTMFYRGCEEELRAWRPVGKFLCVKLVILRSNIYILFVYVFN